MIHPTATDAAAPMIVAIVLAKIGSINAAGAKVAKSIARHAPELQRIARNRPAGPRGLEYRLAISGERQLMAQRRAWACRSLRRL